MKRNQLFIGAVVFFLLLAGPVWSQTPEANQRADGQPVSTTASGSAPPLSPYRIGPGDILSIAVWKDEALTRQLPVLPDGTLHFPLVGKLQAGGKTTEEFQRELEGRITRYVPDPVLSVSVTQVNSMFFYVIGRVNAPGRQVLNANVTALQALAMAGGPNPFAKRNKIKIFREENNQTLIFEFPYDDISKGERLDYNIFLKRGDVMVVP
ncbi:MAG: polysaccharide biosynthesis/export family protein [Desulfobacterales bacterium]|nr:polysaccharide biosynthesis/export family protein [Desulfobacterales bacterium]